MNNFVNDCDSLFFFLSVKSKYIKTRNPRTKIPTHTQEVYKEKPKSKQSKAKGKNSGPKDRQPKKEKNNLNKQLLTPQPGQKINQRVHFFDTMSICQSPQFTQEKKFGPLIRSNPIVENQHVPIMPNQHVPIMIVIHCYRTVKDYPKVDCLF